MTMEIQIVIDNGNISFEPTNCNKNGIRVAQCLRRLVYLVESFGSIPSEDRSFTTTSGRNIGPAKLNVYLVALGQVIQDSRPIMYLPVLYGRINECTT